MAQQPDHCSVTWETWVQRDARQLSWEVRDWNCSHGKIQSSTLTELFNFALSAPSGQPEPPSLQLLTGNCVQLLLPYREKVLKPQLFKQSTFAQYLHRGFSRKRRENFWTGISRQSPFDLPVSLSVRALNHSVFRLPMLGACDVWTAQLASRRHPRLLAEVQCDNEIDRGAQILLCEGRVSQKPREP